MKSGQCSSRCLISLSTNTADFVKAPLLSCPYLNKAAGFLFEKDYIKCMIYKIVSKLTAFFPVLSTHASAILLFPQRHSGIQNGHRQQMPTGQTLSTVFQAGLRLCKQEGRIRYKLKTASSNSTQSA